MAALTGFSYNKMYAVVLPSKNILAVITRRVPLYIREPIAERSSQRSIINIASFETACGGKVVPVVSLHRRQL